MIILLFCRSQVGVDLDFWLQVSQSQSQGIGRLTSLSESSEGESISKVVQAVGRNQFHVVVGLRSSFPCLLLACGHSHLLEASHIPWLLVPLLYLYM